MRWQLGQEILFLQSSGRVRLYLASGIVWTAIFSGADRGIAWEPHNSRTEEMAESSPSIVWQALDRSILGRKDYAILDRTFAVEYLLFRQ
jgi:hypothetical protein